MLIETSKFVPQNYFIFNIKCLYKNTRKLIYVDINIFLKIKILYVD